MNTEELEALIEEKNMLERQNARLLNELKICRDEIRGQFELVTAIKKDMRRYEVQINSLKTENEEFKNKFAKIENNMVGKVMLQGYRWLREMKRRRG